LIERREGRHRRSYVRTETATVRVNETRGSRSSSRRFEKLKQIDAHSPRMSQPRVNVLNSKLNGLGRRALERSSFESEESGSQGKRDKRIVVGVDDGERVENGRTTIHSRAAKKNGELSCVMNSHAPRRSGEEFSGEDEGVDRRIPRKTSVEAENRRVDREGRGVWTTGIGTTPMKEGKTQKFGSERHVMSGKEDQRRWDMEELSDAYESDEGENRLKLQQRRATRGVSTIDGVWNDRRRPDRYDYYREGHSINRASKVMAKCSVNQYTRGGKPKSTSLE
jgi:hypothetical protein